MWNILITVRNKLFFYTAYDIIYVETAIILVLIYPMQCNSNFQPCSTHSHNRQMPPFQIILG